MKLISFGEIIFDVFGDRAILGGAPLNFAAHAALQGSEAIMLSAVGDDELGARALREVRALGVNTDGVAVIGGKQSGKCIVTLNEQKVPSYAIIEDVAYDSIPVPPAELQNADVLAFGTLALRSENNRKTLEKIIENGTFAEVYTDLNIRAPFYSKESIELCLSNATIVKISDEELPIVTEAVFGKTFDCEDAAVAISEKYKQIKIVLITLGKDGAKCYDVAAKKFYYCPIVDAPVVSTVGAGDSFGATFITQYQRTRDVAYSMRLSSKVSAYVVSHEGAIPPKMQEFVENLIK
jgi:fructokinase